MSWIQSNKKWIFGIFIGLSIILSVVYIGLPTYKKIVLETETLRTKVVSLEQDKKEILTEYNNYKKSYSEDTVEISEPFILPNGQLAIDGTGHAAYRKSRVHKKNIVVQDETSKQVITDLTTRLAESQAELSKLKKTIIEKREIRRVVGLMTNTAFNDLGVWADAQIMGPIWFGAEAVVPNVKTGISIKDTKGYLRMGVGF
jgi:gas vesicle protein